MPNADLPTIQAALAAINPDLPRDEWIRIGMALKTELGDAGFALWDEWSRGSPKYENAVMLTQWRNISMLGKVSIGSLFWYAQRAGWQFPRRQRGNATEESHVSVATLLTAKRWIGQEGKVPAKVGHTMRIPSHWDVDAYRMCQRLDEQGRTLPEGIQNGLEFARYGGIERHVTPEVQFGFRRDILPWDTYDAITTWLSPNPNATPRSVSAAGTARPSSLLTLTP